MNELQIISPFPLEDCRLLWSWLQEYPALNLGDRGPQGPEELKAEIAQAQENGAITFEAVQSGFPVGVIWFVPMSPEVWAGHVCFSKAMHGSGLPIEATQTALDHLFSKGATKVSCLYFADNSMVRKFTRKLGAIDEGYLKAHTLRGGKMVDMRLSAIFNPFAVRKQEAA